MLRNRNEERGKRIADSKYNEVYNRIKTTRTPIHLTGELKKDKRRMIARFRCGNEFRGGIYWKAEADKARRWRTERNGRTCNENTWESR